MGNTFSQTWCSYKSVAAGLVEDDTSWQRKNQKGQYHHTKVIYHLTDPKLSATLKQCIDEKSCCSFWALYTM